MLYLYALYVTAMKSWHWRSKLWREKMRGESAVGTRYTKNVMLTWHYLLFWWPSLFTRKWGLATGIINIKTGTISLAKATYSNSPCLPPPNCSWGHMYRVVVLHTFGEKDAEISCIRHLVNMHSTSWILLPFMSFILHPQQSYTLCFVLVLPALVGLITLPCLPAKM